MVHTDTDGRVVLLANVQEGNEAVAYLLDFFCILFVRIFQLLEGAGGIYIVTRIDTYLFGIQGRYLSHFRVEMHVGNQRGLVSLGTQGGVDVLQVFRLTHALCGESHVFTSRLDDTLGLLHACFGIHGDGVRHTLYTDRISATHRSGAHIYLVRLSARIVEVIHSVSWSYKRI